LLWVFAASLAIILTIHHYSKFKISLAIPKWRTLSHSLILLLRVRVNSMFFFPTNQQMSENKSGDISPQYRATTFGKYFPNYAMGVPVYMQSQTMGVYHKSPCFYPFLTSVFVYMVTLYTCGNQYCTYRGWLSRIACPRQINHWRCQW